MAGEFDDLIPAAETARGAFDDLVPASPARGAFDDLIPAAAGPPQQAFWRGLKQEGLKAVGSALKGVGAAIEHPQPTVFTPSGSPDEKLPIGARFIRGGVMVAPAPTFTPGQRMQHIQ